MHAIKIVLLIGALALVATAFDRMMAADKAALCASEATAYAGCRQ